MNSAVHKIRSSETQLNRWVEWGLVLIVVLASTVLPRLMLLGGPPSTDEGVYAYYAQLIHHNMAAGRGLPNAGTLALYPILVSWVFELNTNSSLLLRFADLCVAVVMTLLTYKVLARESECKFCGAILTVIFIFTFNQHLFIQYGFKNSIAAAFVPLLLAFRIGRDAPANAGSTWILAGSLVAISILLRETFLPYALLGVASVFVAKGRRAALLFSIGGCAAGLLIVGIILLLRGGIYEAIQAYRDAGALYVSIADQRVPLFFSSGWASIQESMAALFCSAAALLTLLILAAVRRDKRLFSGVVFWSLVAVVPLIEPFAKIGFPYHFAVSLIGLAGLCAFATGEAIRQWAATRWIAGMVGVIALTFLAGKYPALLHIWPTTREAIAAAPSGQWPSNAIQRSNYLLAAEEIRKVIPTDGSLSVSGFMFALYPLTGHLPPSSELANLSTTIIKLDLSASRLEQALRACAPDVIMTTTRTDWLGFNEITAAVRAVGFYEHVTDIPLSPDRSYGNFGGSIFRRTGGKPCLP